MHTHTPFVLALEPDLRQASVLKRVIRDRVHAELMVVDSRDAAIAATSARIPDVILLTALLSPRDEHELIAHLRGLAGAEHVQTHTIPQLASSAQDGDTGHEQGGGLFGKLRRKKNADVIPGCDPAAFADEVSTFIARAAEMKAHAALVPPSVIQPPRRDEARAESEWGAAPHASAPAPEEPVADAGSAWASPFEWRRPDPAAQKKKDATPRTPLVTNAPLAVVAEEEEARRAEADRRAREEAEKAREHVEVEAAARRERERHEAEAAAHRERERFEADRRAKEEADRRARAEAERRAQEEAERRAKEEADRRTRAEAERRAKEEAERRAKQEAEQRAKEEAERRAKAEAERRAKEEAERRAKEEAAKRERERLIAERRAKEEAERLAKEEEARLARERLEAERLEAARLEAARLEVERLEAERLAKEAERLEAEAAEQEIEIDLDHDPFADFRGEQPESALLKLMPVSAWARTDERRPESSLESPRNDEFHELMAGLSIPTHVAAVAYARGCRIRRVRVPAPRPAPRARLSRPVILSKRALHAAKTDQPSST